MLYTMYILDTIDIHVVISWFLCWFSLIPWSFCDQSFRSILVYQICDRVPIVGNLKNEIITFYDKLGLKHYFL